MITRADKCAKEAKSINIIIILMRSMGMWHVSSRKEQILSNMMLGIVLTSMIVSSIVEGNQFYYARDLLQITYVAPCASAVCSEFSKLIVFIRNREKVMNLNKFVDETFWKVNYSEEDTQTFNECDRLCFKGITLYVISLQGICWHYLLVPLIESIGKDPSERQFPFPIHFDFPITETPFYEIIFFLQIFGTLAVCMCSITFASYLFAINMFTASQFKMLSARLRSLCNFAENSAKDLELQADSHARLKDCIRKHQLLINYTDEIENLYCFVMLGQIFGSVTQICFSGFQILLSNSTDVSLQRTILSVEYLLGSFVQLYFYCYSSHTIFAESESLSRSMYSAEWFKITSPEIRKDFSQMTQIVVHRARRPCTLTVGKFCPLTLDTFASVLSTSLSYFTVLRQTIE